MEKKKNKAGSTKKNMTETSVGISLTYDEKAKIREAANKMHLTMSAYIRLKLFAEGE